MVCWIKVICRYGNLAVCSYCFLHTVQNVHILHVENYLQCFHLLDWEEKPAGNITLLSCQSRLLSDLKSECKKLPASLLCYQFSFLFLLPSAFTEFGFKIFGLCLHNSKRKYFLLCISRCTQSCVITAV